MNSFPKFRKFQKVTFYLCVILLLIFLVWLRYFSYIWVDPDPPKSLIFLDEFLIQPESHCMPKRGRRNNVLTVFVTSRLDEVKLRQIIRQTWVAGLKKLLPNSETFFVVGLENIDNIHKLESSVNKLLLEESTIYGDILQGNFIDTYRNLPLKSIALYKWFSLHCETEFMLKLDSDSFPFIEEITTLLQRISSKLENATFDGAQIWCRVFTKVAVIRNPFHKWFVSPFDYFSYYFPDYCSGMGYLMNKHSPPLILSHLNVPKDLKIRVEDVLLTGIAATRAKVQRNNVPGFWDTDMKTRTICELKNSPTKSHVDGTREISIFPHYIQHRISTPELMNLSWYQYNNCS